MIAGGGVRACNMAPGTKCLTGPFPLGTEAVWELCVPLQCPHRCVLASRLRKSAVVIPAWRFGPFKLDIVGAAFFDGGMACCRVCLLPRPPSSLPRPFATLAIGYVNRFGNRVGPRPPPPPIGLPCPSWPFPPRLFPWLCWRPVCVCVGGATAACWRKVACG